MDTLALLADNIYIDMAHQDHNRGSYGSVHFHSGSFHPFRNPSQLLVSIHHWLKIDGTKIKMDKFLSLSTSDRGVVDFQNAWVKVKLCMQMVIGWGSWREGVVKVSLFAKHMPFWVNGLLCTMIWLEHGGLIGPLNRGNWLCKWPPVINEQDVCRKLGVGWRIPKAMNASIHTYSVGPHN